MQSCEDWGPGGRFKVCRISCNDGMRFSQPVPQFYTCGAEGFWRPNDNAASDPNAPFVYPACSKAKPAQKIFKIKLDYLTDVLCNEAGKGVLKERIVTALQELNKEWSFSSCNQLTESDCEDLGVNINCNQRPSTLNGGGPGEQPAAAATRIKRMNEAEAEEAETELLHRLESSLLSHHGRYKRQVGGRRDDKQAYELEISFPTIDTEEVTNEEGQRAAIENLLKSIILDQDRLSVNDTLPNVLLDRGSLLIDKEFTCEDGHVVADNECVPCPEGTFFDRGTRLCEPCPIGSYNRDIGQMECQPCPEFQSKQGVTETLAAKSVEECKERCPVGQYFDKIVDLCRPCGYGKYQVRSLSNKENVTPTERIRS